MAGAGIKVVARYLFGPGKGIDAGEVRALHAAGIGVGLNYEGQSGNHLKGAQQGAIDGEAARQYASNLGAPIGTPIYYSCDQQVSDSQMPQVMAYLHAADSGPHPSRCYAQYSVVERFGRPAWQTIAWSSGLVSKHAVLYQYEINQDFHGSAVDYNRILDIDQLGAWWPEGSEHDMPTAKEIVDELMDRSIYGSADKPSFVQTIRTIAANTNRDALVKAIIDGLPDTPAAGGGLTKAQVETAVRKVFADAGTAP